MQNPYFLLTLLSGLVFIKMNIPVLGKNKCISLEILRKWKVKLQGLSLISYLEDSHQI